MAVTSAVFLVGVLSGTVSAMEGGTDAQKPLLAYSARIAGDQARTRIVLDFDREPHYSVHYIRNPDRIVVDLPATAFGFEPAALEPRGIFKDIRYGMMDEASARIVLTVERPARIALAKVQEDEEKKGYRLVLDAEMVTEERFGALVAEQSWGQSFPVVATRGDRVTASVSEDDRAFVIAIDAGHGGIDAGARGASTNAQEKDITLAFAKIFVERLKREPGIQAFLTRDKDEFLSLSQRVSLARQRGANVLISLHADTLKQNGIRGATVYTISDKASDRMAADLAERENFSDELAGVDAADKPAEVTDILLDLTRRETQAFSVTMADSVVKSFEGQVALINNPHRYAGFRVLQAHDVPSILLELGFLSNKDDEKLLLDPAWREKVAELLVKAIHRYRAPLVAAGGG